ncbi:MAG TPA: hypothetical protein VHB77_06500, partial [Planctomycetaceae bacterium]|nr:hypothetical protein [Planctomycetaceae bacterium]
QMVVLYWTHPGTAKIRWFAERSLELPQLINLKSTRAIVRVLPPNGCNVALRGLDVSSDFYQSIQRLEALVQFLRLQSEAGAAGSVAFQAEFQRNVLDEIARLQRRQADATTEQRQQLERLRRDVSQLPPVGETRESKPQTVDALFEWTTGEQALGAVLKAPPAKLGMWMIDQNLWSVSWALIAGCASFLIGLRLIRWGLVEWLSRHPSLAAFLLSGFWLVCLAPIWPGVMFAAIGLIWILKSWLSRATVPIPSVSVSEQSAG